MPTGSKAKQTKGPNIKHMNLDPKQFDGMTEAQINNLIAAANARIANFATQKALNTANANIQNDQLDQRTATNQSFVTVAQAAIAALPQA